MALQKIGSGWNRDKGGISIVFKDRRRAFLFPTKDKRSDKSPDYDFCLVTDDDEQLKTRAASQEPPPSIPGDDIPF